MQYNAIIIIYDIRGIIQALLFAFGPVAGQQLNFQTIFVCYKIRQQKATHKMNDEIKFMYIFFSKKKKKKRNIGINSILEKVIKCDNERKSNSKYWHLYYFFWFWKNGWMVFFPHFIDPYVE